MATHSFFGLKHFGVGADEEKKKKSVARSQLRFRL